MTQGVVSNVTSGLLDSPVSGLLGLAFQGISSAGTTPFWQSLADNSGTLDAPLMAFQLTRFVNDSTVHVVESGGTFTLGATNQSLYTGEIDYYDVPSDAVAYWTIPMNGEQNSGYMSATLARRGSDCPFPIAITVQGQTLSLSENSQSFAAIDTGTTLVGGPDSLVQQLYSAIPGSAPGTGNYEGYYTYRAYNLLQFSMPIEFEA